MKQANAESTWLEAWTRAMIRYRLAVVVAWIAIVAASLVAVGQLSALLSNRYSVPGSDAQRVETLLERHYGQLSEGVFQVVVRARDPRDTQRLARAASSASARAARELPKSSVGEARAVSDRVVVATLATSLEQADSKAHVEAMRKAIGEIEGADTYLTGPGAFAYDLDPVLEDDLKRGEGMFAVPVALLILALVFGSLGFTVPFVFALVAIPGTLGVVFAFANIMDLSSYVLNMVVGVGLGISIDYSLLMYYRYREERMKVGEVNVADSANDSIVTVAAAAALRGPDNSPGAREDAVVRTMLTAGRAVVFSGTAVAIGLAALLLMPLPFMQGFGIAGLVISIVSIAAALTLMPVLLYSIAHRLERLRFLPRRTMQRRDDVGVGFWMRLARVIMRRPVLFFVASSLALVALAVPLLDLQLTPGSDRGIPVDIESIHGIHVLDAAMGEGSGTPTTIVIDSGRAGGVGNPRLQAAIARLVSAVRADPEIEDATDAAAPGAVDASKRYVRIDAVGRHDYGELQTRHFVERTRADMIPGAAFPSGSEVLVGGSPAYGVDLVDTAYSSFPWVVALVLLLTYVLLLRAFRSLLLPLKAIVLNLLSIGAAYGLLVLVFGTGIADAFGMESYHLIEFWVPVFMFAMLFGLSMDYEVFLVSRMREEWDAGATNEQAVGMGLARTGRLVTAAGLIMVAAFGGFMAASPVGFQQFGLGLSAAILIDITLVRSLLLPSAMKLFGRWNWWLPVWVARLVRIAPSPLRNDGPGVAAAGALQTTRSHPVGSASPEVRERAGAP